MGIAISPQTGRVCIRLTGRVKIKGQISRHRFNRNAEVFNIDRNCLRNSPANNFQCVCTNDTRFIAPSLHRAANGQSRGF